MLKRAIVIGLLFGAAGWGQHSSLATTQVAVNVGPEGTLAWQNNSVVLVKARLASGTQARVWADDTCGAPTGGSQMISASGVVAIELANLNEGGKALVCLASSDGKISVSLQVRPN